MNDLLARINACRSQAQTCGSKVLSAALRWNTALANAAARHSGDMARNDFFSHTGSDGSSFDQRTTAAGDSGPTIAGNIAAGQSSPAGTVAAWRDSPSHCEAMVNAQMVDIGGSCVQRTGTAYRYYSTIDLGRPR